MEGVGTVTGGELTAEVAAIQTSLLADAASLGEEGEGLVGGQELLIQALRHGAHGRGVRPPMYGSHGPTTHLRESSLRSALTRACKNPAHRLSSIALE